MHPILFEVGGYPVAAYGTALLVAFAAGITVAVRRARAQGLDADRVFDATMLILVSSILGARLLWVVTHPAAFRPPQGTWLDAVNPFQGDGSFGVVGLSMLGGVVLALLCSVAFFAYRRLPVLPHVDVIMPSVLLGEGITRIGCFLNGCCHGLVCTAPWGVRFPEGSPAAVLFPGAAVHPTQLYASLLGFAGFALLVWLARRRPFPGAVFFSSIVLVAGYRIALDFVRYYESQVIVFRAAGVDITINQLISLGLVLAGIAGIAVFGRRHRLASTGG
jgi:phosphatidylglycerol:prolipoprotein diacylglycerol transferase